MTPRVASRSSTLRRRILTPLPSSIPICQSCFSKLTALTRPLSTASPKQHIPKQATLLELWDKYSFTDHQISTKDDRLRHVGFIGKRRNVSKHLSFADLALPSGHTIQLCSNSEIDKEAHSAFRQIQTHAPVEVLVHDSSIAKDKPEANDNSSRPTVYIREIRPLNKVPPSLIVTPDSQFPADKRHLQIRFHPELQARLKFRSWLKAKLSQALTNKGFVDVDTPTLFKSTPEGAREFLVPTRQKNKAYALSQSPQQYKQALMASGITRYAQWARCYRDEDLRADRQPEFSQLDMEWAFAGAQQVQEDVDYLLLQALNSMGSPDNYLNLRGETVPHPPSSASSKPDAPATYTFSTLTFQHCMEAYGSDKPDLRIPGRIHAIPDNNEFAHFISMITHLEDPRVEFFHFPVQDSTPRAVGKVVYDFMENLNPQLANNPDGKPQVLVFDSTKPLCGLSSLGHEYSKVIDLACKDGDPCDGDLFVFQARPQPTGPYCHSSTKLGDFRRDLFRALVDQGLMAVPALGAQGSLQFVWVTEFPMFKPVEEGEPGQGGSAGISACHHPFTAPLSQKDLELLFTNPLAAKSAAYDLVLNGVEVGGGSVRNHLAEVQEFIMRDVLQMTEERMKDFSHLFEILETACPPHAGFALGFDRLVALMSGTSTVRDVIAFPKTMKGEDLFVKSPSTMTNEQLAPYGLQLIPKAR